MAYARLTTQKQFGKGAKYGPPAYDIRHKRIILANQATKGSERQRNKIVYFSYWRDTQKWLKRSKRMDSYLKYHSMMLYRELKGVIDRSSKTDGNNSDSDLQKELKIRRFRDLNFSEDRPIYLIYTNRGRLSAADYQRRNRKNGRKESWFVTALKNRSGNKRIDEETGKIYG